MDFFQVPIFEGFKSRMHWLNKNQHVLTENVANADTPRYAARTLEGQDFSQLLEKTGALGDRTPTTAPVRMVATHAGHMVPPGDVFGSLQSVESEATEVSANGNSVVLEEELRKVGQNQMEYGLMINLYRKHTGLLKTALGGGGR